MQWIVGHTACKIHLRMSKLRSVSARGEEGAGKIEGEPRYGDGSPGYDNDNTRRVSQGTTWNQEGTPKVPATYPLLLIPMEPRSIFSAHSLEIKMRRKVRVTNSCAGAELVKVHLQS